MKKLFFLFGFLLLLSLPFFINFIILQTTKESIFSTSSKIKEAEVILVLGAKTYRNGGVSQIVYDRLIKAAELYKKGKAKKILISGDHGTKGYDEVNTMKRWLLKHKIAEKDIFLDHAGFSTYESIYRAKEIFVVTSMIIVTQAFHLPRALYISKKLGVSSQGYVADRVVYAHQSYNEKREFLARNKDFFMPRFCYRNRLF